MLLVRMARLVHFASLELLPSVTLRFYKHPAPPELTVSKEH